MGQEENEARTWDLDSNYLIYVLTTSSNEGQINVGPIQAVALSVAFKSTE